VKIKHPENGVILFFEREAKLREKWLRTSIFFMPDLLKTHGLGKHAKFADDGRTGYKVGGIEYH
jgi:hypothetical protein